MVSWEGKRIQCQSEDGFCEDGSAFKPTGKNRNWTQRRWTPRASVPINTVWILSHVNKGLGMLESNWLYPHSVICFMKKVTFLCYSNYVFWGGGDQNSNQSGLQIHAFALETQNLINIITLLQTLCCPSINIILMAMRKLQQVYTNLKKLFIKLSIIWTNSQITINECLVNYTFPRWCIIGN